MQEVREAVSVGHIHNIPTNGFKDGSETSMANKTKPHAVIIALRDDEYNVRATLRVYFFYIVLYIVYKEEHVMKTCLYHNLYFGVKEDEIAVYEEGGDAFMVPHHDKMEYTAGMCGKCKSVIDEGRIVQQLAWRNVQEGFKPTSTCLDLTKQYGHASERVHDDTAVFSAKMWSPYH